MALSRIFYRVVLCVVSKHDNDMGNKSLRRSRDHAHASDQIGRYKGNDDVELHDGIESRGGRFVERDLDEQDNKNKEKCIIRHRMHMQKTRIFEERANFSQESYCMGNLPLLSRPDPHRRHRCQERCGDALGTNASTARGPPSPHPHS